MTDSQRKIPRTDVALDFRASKIVECLTDVDFLAEMHLTSDSRITGIIAAAQAYRAALTAYRSNHNPTTKAALEDSREAFKDKYREMYNILIGVNVNQDTKDSGYGTLFMKNPRFNDTTKTPSPVPNSWPIFQLEIKGTGLVDIILMGDSVDHESMALPHKGFIRFWRIILVPSETTGILDESHDILHLTNNNHTIRVNLSAFLSQITGDVKLAVISSYINAVGIHGGSSDPVFLPLPKWSAGAPNTKKNKGNAEGEDDKNDDE